jgi:hypothetical protein
MQSETERSLHEDGGSEFPSIIVKSLPGGAIAGGLVSWVMARKKIREDSVTKIADLQIDLVSEIHLYWSLESRDMSVEATIVRLFQRFAARVRSHLKRYYGEKDMNLAKQYISEAHAAITGAPFSTNPWRRAPWRSRSAQSEIEKISRLVK